jgi:hypothetical protein
MLLGFFFSVLVQNGLFSFRKKAYKIKPQRDTELINVCFFICVLVNYYVFNYYLSASGTNESFFKKKKERKDNGIEIL